MCPKKKHSFSLGGGDADGQTFYDDSSLGGFLVLLRAPMVQSPASKKNSNTTCTLFLRQVVPQMGCFYGVYTLMIEIHPL